MKYPMLVVDKNIKISEREQAGWLKHNIATVRVESMQEAIEKLTKESFLFIAINADNINYMPLLKVMRGTTALLVFLIDSGHTKEDETQAYRNGADAYATFCDDAETNIQWALSLLLRHNERGKQPRMPSGMITYDNFLALSSPIRIFYNDKRLKLTKIEREILYYLIANHDIVLTYGKIYRRVWGRDYDKAGHKSLWDYIVKIRKKLREVTDGKEYIITDRDSGYCFSSSPDII